MSDFDNVQAETTSEYHGLDSVDDAVDAILGNWNDPEEDQVSEQSQEATDEDTDDETGDESANEESEGEEKDQESEDPEQENEESEDTDEDQEDQVEEIDLDEDTLVEITVDGEAKQASIKDLKRLYGQEQSLTRKSQETAAQKKQADESLQKSTATLQAMINRAQERYKPYAEVDMLLASKQMSSDDFAALRAESKSAQDELKFLTEESDQLVGYAREQQAQQQQIAAKECVKVLQAELPEWSNSMYNDIRQYAISRGLAEAEVNQFTDPTVIMLLNKARLYDQSKSVATKKKSTAAKKILRSKKAPLTKSDVKQQKAKATQDKLRNSASRGSDLDDIAAAIMSGWE